MKQIQEWLGHSDISTTANIYAHLDSQSKNLSARTMASTLTLPEAQTAGRKAPGTGCSNPTLQPLHSLLQK